MAEGDGRYRRFSDERSTAAVTTMERQPREKYQIHLFRLGIVENALGVFILATCIVALTLQSITGKSGYTYISPGLWCGIFLFGSGITGLKAKNDASKRIYVANMITSILAAIMMAVLIAISLFCSFSIINPRELDSYIRALHNVDAILGFLAMMVCMIHSAYCVIGLWCSIDGTSNVVVYKTEQSMQTAVGQYAGIPNEGMQPEREG